MFKLNENNIFYPQSLNLVVPQSRLSSVSMPALAVALMVSALGAVDSASAQGILCTTTACNVTTNTAGSAGTAGGNGGKGIAGEAGGIGGNGGSGVSGGAGGDGRVARAACD